MSHDANVFIKTSIEYGAIYLMINEVYTEKPIYASSNALNNAIPWETTFYKLGIFSFKGDWISKERERKKAIINWEIINNIILHFTVSQKLF